MFGVGGDWDKDLVGLGVGVGGGKVRWRAVVCVGYGGGGYRLGGGLDGTDSLDY